ncbi:hypothetical protein CCHR01_09114 [Colletotrichum chrysophilum]|uniref:C2H2-type domain-containing protein n=1 Tax=Colletotrichum chrysophilum TaxID=1836956 RepID=A0AAD9AHL0_9PEZI|nr:hypothetical protein CCHR01_09114 [Colletotrichum chrysophilum]
MVKQIRKESHQENLEYQTDSTTTSYHTQQVTPQISSLISTPISTASSGSPHHTIQGLSLQPSAVVSSSTKAPPLMTTQSSEIICHVAPCRAKKFNSIEDLNEHISEAHKYRCEKGCLDVGYPSVRDLSSRHYGRYHEEEGPAPYVCGRCGKSDSRHDNHTRHLGRVRTCRAKPVAQKYACGRCGDMTYDKEKHLQHLRRRGCQPTHK